VSVKGQAKPLDIRLEPNTEHQAQVYCFDPDSDPMSSLKIEWHIRAEVVVPFGSYSGSRENDAGPIAGLITSQEAKTVRFLTPQKAGAYRLFVLVTDGKGSAGYGNVPFLVEGKPHDRITTGNL
jgi:hypothetical protein